MKDRLSKVYKKLREQNIDALLLSKGINVSYLSGFEGAEAWALVVRSGANFLITAFKYAESARDEACGFKIKLGKEPFYHIVRHLSTKLKVERLGFEANWLSYGEHAVLKRTLNRIVLVPTYDVVEGLRELKGSDEITLLRKAVWIADKTHQLVLDFIKPGRREEELAVEIDYALRLYGAEAGAFQTIVTSGTRTSLPHGRPTGKKLMLNEPVLLDFGARYKGYHSDLTRMVFLGRISQKFKRIYGWLIGAQARAIKRIRPGAVISEIDRAARGYLEDKGLGGYFIHGLGHGVGREPHERPNISKSTNYRLKEGMVITVEPAVYIPGWGGVRVEDVVMVKRGGREVLSEAPRDIINIK